MLLIQVNRTICKHYVMNRLLRSKSCALVPMRDYTKVLVPIKNRKLLKIYGQDTTDFLQGLITNDMRHFEDGAKSIYAMFLNNKGRVLYDSLIHKWENDNCFLIECDQSVFGLIQRHISIYKLKRDVKSEDINAKYNLWALISPANSIPDLKLDPKSDINIYKDPRLAELGSRILTVSFIKGSQVVDMLGKDITLAEDDDVYKYLRYKLGVSEGPQDLPPGMCFPLEVNCDYLHGVSFHKGCYIGQELTARIHHTGIVRKRIMPLKFEEVVVDHLERDTPIHADGDSKRVIGKLKGVIHDYGIGLVRIKEALDTQVLKIGKYRAEVIKPNWWPLEAPKEKVVLSKPET